MAGKSKRVLPFNSQAVHKAAPLDGKQTEYRIDGERGLVLVVTPEGTGSYFFRYTVGHGKARKFRSEKIGRRDDTTLHRARERAGELRQAVGRGSDPVAEGDVRRGAITLRELFEDRFAKDTTKAKLTLNNYRLALEVDVFPALGHLPANEITGEQIARVLEDVEKRTKHAAHRARSAIGSTYRWGMKRRKVRINPTLGLGFTFQAKPRNRVFQDGELKKLWHALDIGPGLTEPMRIILKLNALVAQRVGEICGAQVSELQLDTANPKWRIPSERMKRKNREQIVPLSKQAVVLFKRAIELSEGSQFLFPADTKRTEVGKETRKPHINRESVSRAMARACERIGLKDGHAHDLRKTVTTWLREHKLVGSDVCDLILHHSRRGVTASHYDFSTLEGPVRKALQDWADHVTGEAANASNVVRIGADRGV
jgi:integrase